MKIIRQGKELALKITSDIYFKYVRDFKVFKRSYFYFPYGIVLHSGFKESYIDDLKKIIQQSGKKDVLLFSSKYMKPFVTMYLDFDKYFSENGIKVDVVVPDSKYLGGNMVMGDMMVVSDYEDFLEIYLKDNNPELIIIPSSTFPSNMWHRDLRGIYYKDIERKYKIETKLIECDVIMF